VLGELQLNHVNAHGKREPIGAPIENYYPAIIHPSIWANAQRVRKSHRAMRGVKKDAIHNVFRGLIFTPQGEPIYCQSSHKGKYTYLRAFHNRQENKKAFSWRYDEFKMLFLALVERAREPREPTSDLDESARIELEIEAVKAKEDNLAKALANGYNEAIERALRLLEDDRKALEESLLGAVAKPVSRDASLIDWRDDERLGENLRSCVKQIVVDAHKRAFTVEMLDGSLFSYSENEGEIVFECDAAVVPFPNKKSRSA
jgi:hypothetical protein